MLETPHLETQTPSFVWAGTPIFPDGSPSPLYFVWAKIPIFPDEVPDPLVLFWLEHLFVLKTEPVYPIGILLFPNKTFGTLLLANGLCNLNI